MASSPASAVRPGLRQPSQPQQPPSPSTPNRLISSAFSSPGSSSFRQTEDAIIVELGSRHIRAGFEGEHAPQCVLALGPETSQRVGDYRVWAPAGRRKDVDIEKWGHQHELWRMDLTDLDLGLVEDKIERAVREIYNQFLLTEVGSARLVLILPSILPHPLLSTVISTFFNRWKYSSITLLSSPTVAAVSAGVRSALVVDIGWNETTVTAMYEYREMSTKRSNMAMKSLLKELGRTLNSHRETTGTDIPPIDFELAEEFASRMTWCSPQSSADATVSEAVGAGLEVDLDWPTDDSSIRVRVPFALFSEPVEKTFLASESSSYKPDLEEHSLPMLAYGSLQSLPPDARAVCMSRIVFVGGGSGIPGLAQRIIAEVQTIVKNYGWSKVRGQRVDDRNDLGTIRPKSDERVYCRRRDQLPPEKDYVEERLQSKQAKDSLSVVNGELRQIESLGAWAGASLLTNLKIRGLVEIDRDKFLQHGLAGAQRGGDFIPVSNRVTSYGAGLSKPGGDQTNWTLAGWA